MAKALSSLAVGALVKDTGTLYNGKPIVWKIADKGHTGYPANSVTLITERRMARPSGDEMTHRVATRGRLSGDEVTNRVATRRAPEW